MPIAKDETRLSIEFTYEFEPLVGEKFIYSMKFIHASVGPIVQISNGSYEAIELPADMFTEVAEFLVSQGVIRGTKPPISNPQQMVVSGTKVLGIPTINKTKPQSSTLTTNTVLPSEIEQTENQEMLAQRMAAKERASKAKKPFRAAHKPKD
jgi:hypothetical protein